MFRSLKSNPGGQLAPEQVVGRDLLVRRLWDTLEGRSVVLTAERRMGKTSILRKMEAEAPDRIKTIRRDLENIGNPLEFVERILEDIKEQFKVTDQWVNNVKGFVKSLEGLEVEILGTGVKLPEKAKLHWKSILEKMIKDLMDAAQTKEQKVIFLWDELPLMIDKIRKNEGESVAMDVLDTLRQLRQTHDHLRMVYTGSIGLHHVVTKLKKAGYANAPTNDMEAIEVPPLTEQDALQLIDALRLGEQIYPENITDTVKAIAEGVDYVPFYIHSVIQQLKYEEKVNSTIVEKVIQEAIANNDWELSHFRERINTYYGSNLYPLILAILDILAVEEQPMLFEELIRALQVKLMNIDPEQVREVLKLLRQDHYLKRNVQGADQFYFSLIKRWWCLDRGLS